MAKTTQSRKDYNAGLMTIECVFRKNGYTTGCKDPVYFFINEFSDPICFCSTHFHVLRPDDLKGEKEITREEFEVLSVLKE